MENYQKIVAVISAVTGLLALFITLYSKYRDSELKEQELKLKKEQFDLEKKHQISKEKYQELFEQKIEVYIELYTHLSKFNKQLNDVGRYFESRDEHNNHEVEQLTVEDVNIATLQNIFGIIENNHFVISNTLMESYQKLYNQYKAYTKEFNILYDVGAYGDDDVKKEWDKIKNNFYKQYKTNIETFFNQIDLEIKEIKEFLDMK